MKAWADFGIFRVRYNATGERIEKLEVAKATEDGFAPKMAMDQLIVVSKIEKGATFVTVTGTEGNYQRGADVRVVFIGNKPFLRTDGNTTGEDNLGSLPTY